MRAGGVDGVAKAGTLDMGTQRVGALDPERMGARIGILAFRHQQFLIAQLVDEL